MPNSRRKSTLRRRKSSGKEGIGRRRRSSDIEADTRRKSSGNFEYSPINGNRRLGVEPENDKSSFWSGWGRRKSSGHMLYKGSDGVRRKSTGEKRLSEAERGGRMSDADYDDAPARHSASLLSLDHTVRRRAMWYWILITLIVCWLVGLIVLIMHVMYAREHPDQRHITDSTETSNPKPAVIHPCAHADGRFSTDCEHAARLQVLQRILHDSAVWLAKYGVEYFIYSQVLIAAHDRNPTALVGHPCELVVTKSEFERVKNMVFLGRMHMHKKAKMHDAEAYDLHVVEDHPWDKRSVLFPEFRGEWWAPLNWTNARQRQADMQLSSASVEDSFGSSTHMGVGLLVAPEFPCGGQLRFTDAQTGRFCELLPAHTDDENTNIFIESNGHGDEKDGDTCPKDQCRRHDGRSSCVRIPYDSALPARNCTLFGTTMKCPHDISTVVDLIP